MEKKSEKVIFQIKIQMKLLAVNFAIDPLKYRQTG